MGGYGNMPVTYAQASAYLAKKQDRPVGTGRATRLRRASAGAIEIVLWRTPVATFEPTGGVIVDSGGFRTVTTKQRVNDVLRGRGASVYQDKGEWYICEAGAARGTPKSRIPYADGLYFDANGRINARAGARWHAARETVETAEASQADL